MLIKKKENKELFEAVSFVQRARETSRDYFEGLLKHLKKVDDLLIATDGHKAHTAKTPQLDDGLYDYHRKGSEITLEIVEDSGRVFPAVLGTLNSFKFAESVEISRNEFLQRLKQVNIVLEHQYGGVKFNFGEGKLVIEAIHPDIGDATTELDVSTDAALEIGLNCNYLLEALRGMPKAKVILSLPDSGDKPIKLAQGILEAFVMPMRI